MDDDWGSLVTLCGCLLRVLKYRDERWDRGWRKKASDIRLGFAIFHMGDKLAKHKQRYASEVYRFLATMIVPCRKPDDSKCAAVATPDSLLAETVSSWVGHWFTEYPSILEDEEDLESRPFLTELKRLLEYCSATEPHRAEHLYRLGLTCVCSAKSVHRQRPCGVPEK